MIDTTYIFLFVKKNINMISCIWLNNQCRQRICKKENDTFISYLILRLSWIQRTKRYSQEKQQERRSQHWAAAQQCSRHHFFSSSPQQVFVHNNFSHRTPEADGSLWLITLHRLYILIWSNHDVMSNPVHTSQCLHIYLLPINEVNWMNHIRL